MSKSQKRPKASTSVLAQKPSDTATSKASKETVLSVPEMLGLLIQPGKMGSRIDDARNLDWS